MPAYCLFDILEITDAEKMDAYRARVFECVARHGGKYLVVGGPLEVVEGHWKPAFPVVIEFPSMEAAHRWYRSPDYAPLKALRLDATRANAVFMESFSPPAA